MSAVDDVVRQTARTAATVRPRTWLTIALALPAAFVAWRVVHDFLGRQGVYGIALIVSIGVALYLVCALRAELHASERNAAELMDAYVRARHEIERLDRSYRERLHDARSAAISVRGAVHLLSERIGTHRLQDRQLQRLLATELERMHALLDGETSEPAVDFDLADALEPIVMSHRMAGARINATLTPVTVHGRPLATASVLDNLLRNAAVHAPGAQVAIGVVTSDESITVTVDDDGPGIPADECELVLRPGERGSRPAGPGSGLGLHIAATVMAEQSGRFTVAPRPGGGTRAVFTLPAAGARPPQLAPAHPLAS